MKTASWIIRDKKTKKVVLETFNKKAVDALNTTKYEAVPILEYLQSINTEAKRMKNPAAKKTIRRVGVKKSAYVKRASQATRKAPTKRLVARRKSNAVGSGRFPNPAPKKGLVRAVSQSAWGPGKRGEFDVYAAGAGVNSNAGQQKLGALLARFPSKAAALEYAQAWATAKNRRVIVTGS